MFRGPYSTCAQLGQEAGVYQMAERWTEELWDHLFIHRFNKECVLCQVLETECGQKPPTSPGQWTRPTFTTDRGMNLLLQMKRAPWKVENPGSPASLTHELGLQGER